MTMACFGVCSYIDVQCWYSKYSAEQDDTIQINVGTAAEQGRELRQFFHPQAAGHVASVLNCLFCMLAAELVALHAHLVVQVAKLSSLLTITAYFKQQHLVISFTDVTW